jgi:hypothetical protein
MLERYSLKSTLRQTVSINKVDMSILKTTLTAHKLRRIFTGYMPKEHEMNK